MLWVYFLLLPFVQIPRLAAAPLADREEARPLREDPTGEEDDQKGTQRPGG